MVDRHTVIDIDDPKLGLDSPEDKKCVLDLNGPKAVKDGVFELVARVARAPDVNVGYDKVFLTGQVVVIVQGPPLAHILSAWAAVAESYPLINCLDPIRA